MNDTTNKINSLPSVNISKFFSGSSKDKNEVAQQVAKACREVGFLLISGHGISESQQEVLKTKTFDFFDLPLKEKQKWAPIGSAKQRGYQRIETRNLASTIGEIAPPDLRETIFIGPIDGHRSHYAEIPGAENAYAQNIIPSDPEGTKEAFIEAYRIFEKLSSSIMRIMALALDLPEAYFCPLISKHFSVLGIHHYPVLTEPPKTNQLRAGAHTDFGAITILSIPGSESGLEVKMDDNSWLKVSPKDGELVVNLGDMMQRWTNDEWRSTHHRVTVPKTSGPQSRRLSIAYFVHPNFDAKIECLGKNLKLYDKPKYEIITAGEHIRQKMEASLHK
jgi:isopenicillin N synthase-like dioxygenase